jgi:hypothetical protein
MVVKGTVRGGVVVLEAGAALADGTEVRVEVVTVTPPPAEADVPTLYERVKDFIGIADGLPPDMAENHDHYLHGRLKKS